MLSTPDAALAARDPALSGLAVVLDPDAMLARARERFPELDVTSLAPTYARYKPGVNCLVLYRLACREASALAYVKTFADGAIAWHPFPEDTTLHSLRRLDEPDARAALLRKILPGHEALWRSDIGVLAYKPERRFVARLTSDDGTSAVLKAYSEEGFATARVATRPARSAGDRRWPRWLGRSTRHRVLVFEWMPGQPLSGLLQQPGYENAVSLAGACLAGFHARSASSLRLFTGAEEDRGIAAAAESVGSLHPGLRALGQRLVAELRSRLHDDAGEVVLIHGDFYAKQVVVTDHGDVRLVDLDRAALGHPTVDLGNFIAHAEREVLNGAMQPSRRDAVVESLLDGYGSRGARVSERQLATRTAAALLKLAPDPFRHRQPDWARRMEVLLERAESLLRPPAGSHGRVARVRVTDPFGIGGDEAMPFAATALQPDEMSRLFATLPSLRGLGETRLLSIDVRRHKRGRRALVAYGLEVADSGRRLTALGKIRVKGADRGTCELHQSLRDAGLDGSAPEGAVISEPLAVIPELHMWLQREAPGISASTLLLEPDGRLVAQRIARALHALHDAGVPAHRTHTMDDELRMLDDRLVTLAASWPDASERLAELAETCRRLGRELGERPRRGIHRDFYPDHAIVDGGCVTIVDLDLYADGDPALDAGNFIAHVTELSLRRLGDPLALRDRERAFVRAFADPDDAGMLRAIEVYTLLALARHLWISTRFDDRKLRIPELLALCESRARALAGTPGTASRILAV